VRIERVEVAGFGCLGGRDFDFAPGLNVVAGPNEAGKSTLLQAILALLYGFPAGRGQLAGLGQRDLCLPWQGDRFSGNLVASLDDGQRYRLERDFKQERTKVYRQPGAEDVTNQFNPGRHGLVDFADQCLGLSAPVFHACALIRQEGLALEKGDVEALHAKLESLADSGGVEQTAQEALDTLRTWLSVKVGPLAHIIAYSPLKSGEQEVQDLGGELKRSREALAALADLFAKERTLDQWVRGLADLVSQLAGNVAWCERAERQTRLQRVTELEEAIDKLALEVGNEPLPDATLDDVARASDAVVAWPSAETAVQLDQRTLDLTRQGQTEHVASRTPELAALVGRPTAELNGLLASAIASQHALARAAREVGEENGSAAGLIEYRMLTDQLAGLDAQTIAALQVAAAELKQRASSRSAPGLPALLVTAVAGIVGLAIGGVAAGVVGAVFAAAAFGGLAYFWVSNRTRSASAAQGDIRKRQAELANALGKHGVSSIEELQLNWNRRAELAVRVGEASRRQRNVEEAQSVNQAALAALTATFGSPEPNVARTLLDQLADWTAKDAELGTEGRLAADRLTNARRSRDAKAVAAREALFELRLTADEPVEARRALAELRQRLGRKSDRDAKLNERRLVLGADTVVAIQEQVNALGEHATKPDAADQRSLAELRTALEKARQDYQEAVSSLTRLTTQREERLKDVADPAEIEERLAAAQEKLAQVRRLRAAIEEASKQIRDAAASYRRDFAPLLGQCLSRWMAHATRGRYAVAEVSPTDLKIQVHSAERGGLVPVDQLSRGTRDALTLLLRASVVDLLSTASESVPLFLDDPLVHVDPERCQAILTVLGELATVRQIFYFTQDPRVVEWVGGGAMVHELAGR
jgi:DNA repair protein SbcC/Rad50